MRYGQVGIPLSPDFRGADGRDAPLAHKETGRCRAINEGKRCNTILSRYNSDSDLCFACSAKQARGAKLELAPDDRPKTTKGKKGRGKKSVEPTEPQEKPPTSSSGSAEPIDDSRTADDPPRQTEI